MRIGPALSNVVVAIITLSACSPMSSIAQTGGKPLPKQRKMTTPKDAESLVVAGGCFWCVETVFEELEGVYEVESAYVGGHVENPTYAQVCTGKTGHAEAIKIFYDKNKIAASDLLKIFLTTHDPTTLNRQGPDSGTQYRSAIFYRNASEKALAEAAIKEVTAAKIWPNPIVTTVEALTNYYRAEDYHQDYFARYEKASEAEKAGFNAGYCAVVIEPKVRKFREKYAAKLRKKS